jgi:hypothetical protein
MHEIHSIFPVFNPYQAGMQTIFLYISEFVFWAWFALALGASVFGVAYQSLANHQKSKGLMQVTANFVSQLHISKNTAWGAGLVSLISLAFLRVSLLGGVISDIFWLYGLAVVFGSVAISLLNTYKTHLDLVTQDKVKSSVMSGVGASICLLMAGYFYSAATGYALDETQWGVGAFTMTLFKPLAMGLFLMLVSASLAATGVAISFFAVNGGIDNSRAVLIQMQRGVKMAYLFIPVFVISVMIHAFSLSEHVVTTWTVSILLAALLAMFFAFKMLEAIKMGSKVRFERYAFPLALFSLALVVLNLEVIQWVGARDSFAKQFNTPHATEHKVSDSDALAPGEALHDKLSPVHHQQLNRY